MNDSPAARVNPSKLDYPRFAFHFSEFIGIGDNGHLWVEGRDTVELAETFGTPLHVLSEGQLRHNYRRFRDAFASRYAGKVEILFANKSNNSLAVRHVMNQEGAGGDCFGVNEMYLALLAGTDPRGLVLNGSNKDPAEIEMAVANGVTINIDALDEVDVIAATCERLDRDVDVGIRVKLELPGLAKRFGTSLHGPGSMADIVSWEKWGMTYPQTAAIAQRIRQSFPRLHLTEINFHLARLDKLAEDFAVMARDMVEWCARLRRDTGWCPAWIDLGGGWTFGRKEKTGVRGVDDETTPTPEQYAEAVCAAVSDEIKRRELPLLGMRIEPGRAISGTAGIALGRVGASKDWPELGRRWVNVDLSGNHVPWITAAHHYHIVAANKARIPGIEAVDVVGPLCTHDILGKQRTLPRLERGDLVALLDTGAYAESQSANYNAQLRPATVLVSGKNADVTTERERLSDVAGRFKVPPRLIAGSFGPR
jgi:diaminopimelate decarboxylase